MATMNFSIPNEIKDAFNAAFKGRNKSAIVARLLRQAVEEEQRKRRREEAFAALTAGRAQRPERNDDQLTEARRQGRP